MRRFGSRSRPCTARALQLVATAGLLLLVFGMPIWLAVVAGRPSVHVDMDTLRQAISRHDPGEVRQVGAVLGQVSVMLAWLCWAWLTVCIVLEVIAWRSGRSPVDLPASRSVQYAVALMVGTAFAVGTLSHLALHDSGGRGARGDVNIGRPLLESSSVPSDTSHGSDLAAWPSGPDRPDLTVAAPAGPAADLPDRSPVDGSARTGPAPSVHTVCHRETLWSIAEDRLGSPQRWRELAALNYGIRQQDGSCLTEDHWVVQDWQLVLPSPHRPVAAGHQAAARAHLGPSGGIAAPIDHGPPVPVVPLGAGIVGLGVADLVDRLRRVQQRHRSRGRQIRLPDPMFQPFEQRVRAGDGAEHLDAIDAALRALARATGAWPAGARLLGARTDQHRVSLVFDAEVPLEPGTPFSVERDGCTVTVDRTAVVDPTGRPRNEWISFPSPTLVSIGRTNGVLVMVDLEGHGSVSIEGSAAVAEGVSRALALELATSRWARAFDLLLVGFDASPAFAGHVGLVAEPGSVIADLSWRRLTTSVRLDEGAAPSVDAARRQGVVGDWRPVVVMCAPGMPADDVAVLLDLAGDGRYGICVVAVAGDDDDLATKGRLRLGSSVEVLGATVSPQSLDPMEYEHTGFLLHAAHILDADGGDDDAQPGGGTGGRPDGGDDGGLRRSIGDPDQVDQGAGAAAVDSRAVVSYDVPRSGVTQPLGPVVVRPRGSDRAPGAAVGSEVEVAVLGPVEVRGAARPFTRAWALELVVYLAMHPGGASNEMWATALWPERLMAPSSLHSTASVARRSLGKAADGSDHLPRCHGRLALAGTVGTDWGHFQELAASADPEHWEEALTLVRGRPFEGIRAADWTLLDGTAPAIESAVVDVSGRLAGFRLRSGDPHRAEWAARKGLLVSPYDERLYRMLLRTADSAGNPGGVEAVMAELVRVVADEVEPIESVHPSTLALYRSLSRRNHQALRPTDSGPR